MRTTLRTLWALAGLLLAVPSAAQDQENSWGFHLGLVRLDLLSVYESNIDREVTPTDDYGLKAGGLLRVQSQTRDPLAYLEYRGLMQTYANTNNWDRISHRFRVGMGGEPVKDLELGIHGDLNTRTANADQRLVNQFTVLPSVAFPGPGHLGLQVYAAYRVRNYINVTGEDEIIRYVGAEGQTRLWMSARFTAEVRYEEADSQSPSEDYIRRRVEGKLEQHIGRRDRLRMSVQYRVREYPHDKVTTPEGEVGRVDHRWIPGVRWTHRLVGGRQIELDYQFQGRTSNNPDKEYEAHRITLAFRWPLFR